MFAILLVALAPGLARALASPQQGMPWSEICTVGGPRVAPDAAPDSGTGQHDGTLLKHCPCCLNHAGQFALPATPPGFRAPGGIGAESPFSILAAGSPHPDWTSPHSRAPPAIS